MFAQNTALRPVAKMVAESKNSGITFKQAAPFNVQINPAHKSVRSNNKIQYKQQNSHWYNDFVTHNLGRL